MIQNESLFTKFTADNCEKEPIHIPGSVQTHGVLFALRQSDFTILQVSENCFDLLGVHHDELLHQPLSQLMDIASVERATARLGEKVPRLLNPIPIEISVRGQKKYFDGILHRSARVIILELERHVPSDEGYGGFGGFYEAIREVATRLMHADTIQQVMQIACEEVLKLTDYSRVLAYKFDENWNGTVIAEAKKPHVKSLLHHRFPSTDIPKQARELYTTNWLRIIPDANYKPSAITPQFNPLTDRPLDLSNSVLRSVSPVHIEYMKNMGQRASMSVSLLNEKALWGLISCHNEETGFLKYDVRVACEFIGQMVSAQISARKHEREANHASQLIVLFGSFLESFGKSNPLLDLKRFPSALLGLTNATGAALYVDGAWATVGKVPKDDDLASIRESFRAQEPISYTNSVAGLNPDYLRFAALASGVLSIRVSPSAGILWFRPEMTESIQWGGNPNLSRDKGSLETLSPRKSFETWLETVTGRSTNWAEPEVEAARRLLEAVQNFGDRSVITQLTRTSYLRSAIQDAKEHAEKAEVPATVAPAPRVELKALLEGLDEFAVLFLDGRGVIQNWSMGARRLLGYDAHQTVGKKFEMFLSTDEAAKDKHNRIINYVREHKRCEEELWLYKSDGTSFWAKIMVAKVRGETLQHIGFSVVVQDISSEKAAQEELKSTKLAAEAANQAKSSFLANISHEILTPLGAVLGFADLLASSSVSAVDKASLGERIRVNGEQLTNLINDLLDMTKVESNRLDVETLDVDFQALVREVTETLHMKASEKSILLNVTFPDPVPKQIQSDPTRLRQIFVNIINNAIKFTPEGGEIEISLRYRADLKRVFVRVRDTGAGMTERQMAGLFKPFSQADVSTTRKYGGSGLGLYVSQRLARLLGGDVSIESSEPGKGSTFLISFGAGEAPSTETFSSLAKAIPRTSSASQDSVLAGVKILIVDDAPDNRRLIALFLKQVGASFDVADNGKDALKMAAENAYDVILMDIQMPIMDGNTAMRLLLERGYKKPVIALTAHAMVEEREQSLRAGFNAYLTKPINRELLVDTIARLIGL